MPLTGCVGDAESVWDRGQLYVGEGHEPIDAGGWMHSRGGSNAEPLLPPVLPMCFFLPSFSAAMTSPSVPLASCCAFAGAGSPDAAAAANVFRNLRHECVVVRPPTTSGAARADAEAGRKLRSAAAPGGSSPTARGAAAVEDVVVVDLHFREQFSIPQPTEEYAALLAMLPPGGWFREDVGLGVEKVTVLLVCT